jgi:hypothetical protein
MAELRCQRNHVVNDPDATECPTCGAPLSAASVVGQSGAGVALIGIGLLLTVVAALVWSAADGDGLGGVLAAALGLAGSTAWLVGCIAEGVRIGRRG